MWTAGLVVAAGSTPLSVGTPTAVTAQTGEVALNGRLQYGVTSPHWKFTGTIGSFGVFHNTQARGWAWVEGPAGGKPAPGQLGPSLQREREPADHRPGPLGRPAGPERVVRLGMEGHHPDLWRPPPGPSGPIPVVRVGITQGVELPAAGKYLVSFNYRPASAQRGLVISAGAGVGLVVWLAVETVLGRRRRRARRRGHPA